MLHRQPDPKKPGYLTRAFWVAETGSPRPAERLVCSRDGLYQTAIWRLPDARTGVEASFVGQVMAAGAVRLYETEEEALIASVLTLAARLEELQRHMALAHAALRRAWSRRVLGRRAAYSGEGPGDDETTSEGDVHATPLC
jgi:hypothetical protein